MFGPGYIAMANAADNLRDLLDRDEDLIYEADEIATERAIEAGWDCDEEGRWFDADGDEVVHPLDDLYGAGGHLPDDLRESILDGVIRAYNERKGA